MMYRYQPRRAVAEPAPFWVRHPHVVGFATFVVIMALGLLLSGCECGRLWPCPGA